MSITVADIIAFRDRIREQAALPYPEPRLIVPPAIHRRVQAVADREGVNWMTAAYGIMYGQYTE